MRRFTILTNVFSKKADNLKAAVALHFAHYNFVRYTEHLGLHQQQKQGLITGCGLLEIWLHWQIRILTNRPSY